MSKVNPKKGNISPDDQYILEALQRAESAYKGKTHTGARDAHVNALEREISALKNEISRLKADARREHLAYLKLQVEQEMDDSFTQKQLSLVIITDREIKEQYKDVDFLEQWGIYPPAIYTWAEAHAIPELMPHALRARNTLGATITSHEGDFGALIMGKHIHSCAIKKKLLNHDQTRNDALFKKRALDTLRGVLAIYLTETGIK